MPEICPYCGGTFFNSKALGSHIRYIHESASWAYTSQNRAENETEQFRKLFDSCLAERNLRRPRQMEKIEQALTEIPEGVSPTLDKYRNAYRCAIGKEKFLKEIEEELIREAGTNETKESS